MYIMLKNIWVGTYTLDEVLCMDFALVLQRLYKNAIAKSIIFKCHLPTYHNEHKMGPVCFNLY